MVKKPTTYILVKELMKQYSDGFQISKDAWLCMKDRIEIFFERNMKSITDIAKTHNRKTVFESDVIDFFSRNNNNDLDGE